MKKNSKYDTPLRIICAVLFATFSFLYIYLFQGELLALVQDFFSQGKTTNDTFITAILITLLLMVLQFLLNRVGKLHGRYEAFSYLPSGVLLALMTKVDATYSYSWVQWLVTLLIVAALYLLLMWINRNTFEPRDAKFLRYLSLNLGVLTALFVFVGWYGNNLSTNKMELAAWKYTHSREYDRVLMVGRKSNDSNVRLTALRNLALAKTGQLGDKMFTYPQPYGSEGLLMNRYNVQTREYGSEEFYGILGAYPYGGEKASAFYKRIAMQFNINDLYMLYAAALLLDKDLEDFSSLLLKRGLVAEGVSDIPVHYQEALLIYNEQYPFTPVTFVPNEAIVQRYQEYLALREANADKPIVMQSLCKRNFGNTYWYYHDFVH